jgi:hypothetical protein
MRRRQVRRPLPDDDPRDGAHMAGRPLRFLAPLPSRRVHIPAAWKAGTRAPLCLLGLTLLTAQVISLLVLTEQLRAGRAAGRAMYMLGLALGATTGGWDSVRRVADASERTI